LLIFFFSSRSRSRNCSLLSFEEPAPEPSAYGYVDMSDVIDRSSKRIAAWGICSSPTSIGFALWPLKNSRADGPEPEETWGEMVAGQLLLRSQVHRLWVAGFTTQDESTPPLIVLKLLWWRTDSLVTKTFY